MEFKMGRHLLLIVVITLFSGCEIQDDSTDDGEDENLIVYKRSGKTQCNSDGMTYTESQQVLIDAGIDVISTQCGAITGIAYPAVCGGPTGEIFGHEIRRVNLGDARDLGYEDIEELVDETTGLGYRLRDCDI